MSEEEKIEAVSEAFEECSDKALELQAELEKLKIVLDQLDDSDL